MKKDTAKKPSSAAKAPISDKAIASPATESEVPPEPSIRILKSGTCPSLSSKSTLTYQIACANESDCALRLSTNSGGGHFNQDWIPIEVIVSLLVKWPDDKPITSYVLYPLFRGKSSNTTAFLFAVLKAEGLIEQTSKFPRVYQKRDSAPFLTQVSALMDAHRETR